MSWAPEAFSLAMNSIASFFTGLLVVWLILIIMRPKNPRLRYLFWLLPFLKIPFDLAFGVPNWACVNKGVSLLSAAPGTTSIAATIGFGGRGPFAMLELLSSPNGSESICSWSLGDLIHIFLVHYGHAQLPQFLLLAVAIISLTKVLRRATGILAFERERLEFRKSDLCTPTQLDDTKSVDTYISKAHSGSPFTGGILFPYICFPADTHAALSETERDAVWKHERSHVRWRDSAVNLAIDFLGDLFWFVPGYQLLKRRILEERELSADAMAVSSGSDPYALGSALLALCERGLASGPTSASYAGLFLGSSKSLVERRVVVLSQVSKPSKNGVIHATLPLLRTLAGYGVWLVVAVSLSTSTLGGHTPANPAKRETSVSELPLFLQPFFSRGGKK
jgi:beta-lactamase regulating signal transducer with metallopeptidase domain